MTIQEFAERFGLNYKSAVHYLKDNARASKIVKINGKRRLIFDEKDIDEAAALRELRHRPFDPETEHDRLSIEEALKAKRISQKDQNAFIKHPGMPEPTRIRPPGHIVYDKKAVDDFIESYFGKTRGVVARKREIKGNAAKIIFFCTGRYWRFGDTITTRLIHGKEV